MPTNRNVIDFKIHNLTEEQFQELKDTGQIDPLHAERQRKVVLGTWTETDEEDYVAEVKRLTEKIQTENPYIE